MRDFSATLKTALLSRITTLGWLMSITRRDGTVIRTNTIGADFSWGGETWYGYPGFNMGDAKFTDSADPGTFAPDSAGDGVGPILFDDVVAGLYSGARVRLYLVDYTSSEGTEIGFKWEIGNVAVLDNGKVSFDIWSKLRTNQALFLKKVGPGCTASLGDARCGVDVLASWTDSVTVDGANIDAFSFLLTGLGSPIPANDWYENGAIIFDAGENSGFAYDVRRWVQSTRRIYLRQPLRRPLVTGTAARIYPGCDKTTGAAGCGRFSNNARFQGFLHAPTDFPSFTPPVAAPPPEERWYPKYR